MPFKNPEDEKKELTYQDVFLYPQYSEIGSRMGVDLTPSRQLPLTIPLIVANMNAVAGKRMTETVTRRGGLVVLPQDKTYEQIKFMVEYLKGCHPVYETPVVLKERDSVQKALNLIHKRSHGAVLVVDSENKPVGIFTETDAKDKDLYTPIDKVMTKNLVTMSDGADYKQVYNELVAQRLPVMPIVDSQGKLVGVLTKKGALRAEIYKPALNDRGEFLTCVAVGINANLEKRINALIEMRVDLIVLDTAHGHQNKMLDAIKFARSILGPDKPLMAGNVVTAQAAEDMINAGVSMLKVGVGPGAACTTRMMTGVGRPQFSAVYEVSRVAKGSGVEVCADGGCKHPRDVALALSAGANFAMVGTWFAGTYESPADIQISNDGRLFKENFGMASNRAVKDRTDALDPFAQAKKEYFVEGISRGKMYLKAGEESVEDIIDKITAGVRSSFAYAGVSNLQEFHEKVLIGVQSASGYQEGKPVEERW
ncbi:MAG: GuaB1 family IMP dehydrogenase-related protein [Patescibacteria group bacterium]